MDVIVPGRQDRASFGKVAAAAAALAAVGMVTLVAYGHYSSPRVLGATKTAMTEFNVASELQSERAHAKALLMGTTHEEQALAKKTPTAQGVSSLAHDDCMWTYEGNMGPMNWAKICGKKYPLCGDGTEQSPIDIIESKIEKVNDGFTETIGWVLPPDSYANFLKGGGGDLLEEYNGHAFQVDHIGAYLEWGPKGQKAIYNLQQFHMHTPSEHKVNGVHYEMEMHFVHTLADDTDSTDWSWTPKKYLIVAQFFKAGTGEGTPNWLRQLSQAASAGLTADAANVIPVDFAAISQSVMVGSLPQNGPPEDWFRPNWKNWFKYDGSLTTPPCTEGVQWVVLRNPIFVEKADMNPILRLEGENYRPVQPMGDRKMVSNIDKWDSVDISASGR